MRGYRKFTVVMVAMASAFVLALLARLTAEYATIVSVCVGAFAYANAKEHTGKGDG